MKKINYYQNYDKDFIESSKQDYKLKDNYKWIHHNIIYLFFSYICYYIVLVVAFVYCKFYLRVTVKNRGILKTSKKYFIYSNHTQMLGDVLSPFLINFPKRPYIICSPANLGIPIIGKILPMCGALPIPDNLKSMKEFLSAINYHNSKKHPIVIYPEGHLWPWCSFIREFNDNSFHFPVDNKSDVYVATTTYQKSKIFKKPKITIIVDGPIKTKENLSRRENIKYLHNEVYNKMLNSSKLSNTSYMIYKKSDSP